MKLTEQGVSMLHHPYDSVYRAAYLYCEVMK